MKYLVAYYSRTGNNRFIAETLAQDLSADIVKLVPRVNTFFMLIFSSLLHLSFGNKKIEKSVTDYDAVILCGPIWMGQLIAPLWDFIKKYKGQYKKLYFLTCCGSGEEEKDGKFGYMGVFKKVEQFAGPSFVSAQALPVSFITAENTNAEPGAVMNLRVQQDTFTGKFKEYYREFIQKLIK